MVEIEYKFRVEKGELPALARKLTSLGFQTRGRAYEKTTMYDNDRHLMQRTNGRVRVRNIGDNRVEFSYKKPLADDGGPKKEIEYEVFLTHNHAADSLVHIVENMGFHETTSYERYRTTYAHSLQATKVTLDEFPFADFIEVEGSEKEASKTALALGFNVADHLNKPCDTLFNDWRAEQGLPATDHMTFADYDK